MAQPTPPAGFVLDTIPPPVGFVMDTAPSTEAKGSGSVGMESALSMLRRKPVDYGQMISSHAPIPASKSTLQFGTDRDVSEAATISKNLAPLKSLAQFVNPEAYIGGLADVAGAVIGDPKSQEGVLNKVGQAMQNLPISQALAPTDAKTAKRLQDLRDEEVWKVGPPAPEVEPPKGFVLDAVAEHPAPPEGFIADTVPVLEPVKPVEIIEKATPLKEVVNGKEEGTKAEVLNTQAGEQPAPTEVKQPWEMTREDIESKYPTALDTVDGMTVGSSIKNRSSIDSSLDNSSELDGIREVQVASFEDNAPPKFYSKTEETRTKDLAEQIRQSGQIDPLIVVDDGNSSPYILEGGHRFDALKILGAKSFPAKVVIDEGAYYTATKQALSENKPVPPEVLADYPDLKAAVEAPAPEVVPEPATGEPGKGEVVSIPLIDTTRTGDTPGGEVKPRGLSKNMEGSAIDAGIIEKPGDLGALPTYEVRSKPQERISAFVDTDAAKARRVADGLEDPPSGVLRAEVFTELRKRAEAAGDADAIVDLLKSPMAKQGTELGREIQSLDAGTGEVSPFRSAQEIDAVRSERLQKIGKPPATPSEIEALSARLKEVEDKLAAYHEGAAKKQAEKVVRDLVKRESRKATRAITKESLDVEFKGLSQKLNSILNPNKLNVGIDPAAIPVLVEMAKNRIRSGIVTAEGVIDSIHTEVKQFIEVSKREIRDAISGYGKTSELSQEDIAVKLREVKRQGQLISALEDAKTGEAPLRSGLQRGEQSDRVRELSKQVKDAMRESGIDSTRSPEAQWKSAIDARKTALRNQIVDLKKQIETGLERAKKEALKYDKEANRLKAERDRLSVKWQEKKALIAEMKKKGVSDEDPHITALNKFMADTERQIKAKEAALDKAITEKKRRIAESDLDPHRNQPITPDTPVIAKKQIQLDKLNEEFRQLRKDARPHKDPDEIRLQTFKTRLANETARLEKALEEGNLTKPEKKSPVSLDPEARRIQAKRDRIKEDYNAAVNAAGTVTKEEVAKLVELSKTTADAKAAMEQGGDRLVYGANRVAYEEYVNHLKGADLPIKTLLKNRVSEFKTTASENKAKAVYELSKDTLQTITDNSIAMVATLDNSFLGRQGLKTLMTHPSAWWPGAVKSFSDFAKTLGGKNSHDALMADIYSRPNYLNGEYQRAKVIPKNEEQYPTTLPERIPVVGRVFRASEYAFTGSGLRMRTDLYDLLSAKAKENGVDMASKVEAESLGKMINSLTARGQWGKRGDSGVVRIILWAPKMLKGNIDVLTAHNLGAGLESSFARKEAAMNLVKIAAETASLMMIANALLPGSAEYDPRSSDFGKIKVRTTRFDITGGAASIVTLASRILTRSFKSTQTGRVTDYGIGYGKKSPFDALVDFLMNKTSPPARVVVDWLKGKDRNWKPFTWSGAAYNAFTPISLQNFINLKDDVSADKVAGAILDLIGINANSYDTTKKKHGYAEGGMIKNPPEMQHFEGRTADNADSQPEAPNLPQEGQTEGDAATTLLPAVMFKGKQYVGTPEQQHEDILKAHGIGRKQKHVKGFIDRKGKFKTK